MFSNEHHNLCCNKRFSSVFAFLSIGDLVFNHLNPLLDLSISLTISLYANEADFLWINEGRSCVFGQTWCSSEFVLSRLINSQRRHAWCNPVSYRVKVPQSFVHQNHSSNNFQSFLFFLLQSKHIFRLLWIEASHR